jgi:hypothetical protein
MTTQEFLQGGAVESRIAGGEYRSPERLSREADLVKFARHVPTPEQGERAYEAARISSIARQSNRRRRNAAA